MANLSTFAEVAALAGDGTRAVSITPKGERVFREKFGVRLSEISQAGEASGLPFSTT